MSDDDYGAVLGSYHPVGSDAPRPATFVPSAWVVEYADRNSSGDYYVVCTPNGNVSVKHSRKHDRVSCGTCHTADQCQHSLAVRQYIARAVAA